MVFIALNSYGRIPRNFFGFKKNLLPVQMPFTVSVQNEHGAVGNYEIKDAKLKDDISWDNRRSERIIYGNPTSEDEIAVWLHDKLTGIQETVLVFDGDMECLDNLYKKHWMSPLIEEHCETNIVPFYQWLHEKVQAIPTSHFLQGMADGNYEMTMHLQEVEDFTPTEKATIFYSHTDFPIFYERESSVNRAWKMWEAARLVEKEIERVKQLTV